MKQDDEALILTHTQKEKLTVPKKPKELADQDEVEKKHSNSIKIKREVSPIKEQEYEEECISLEKFNQDPNIHVAKSWLSENLVGGMLGDLTFYRNATKEELLDAANIGDTKAMWTLGMNYSWNALHDNFTSPFVRPLHQTYKKSKGRPLDTQMLQLARDWFKRAALNGLAAGIVELAQSYTAEIGYLKETEPDNLIIIEKLEMKRLAYFVLYESIAPELSEVLGKDSENPYFQYNPISNPKETAIKYEKILSDIQSDWEKERAALGLYPKLELHVPEEVYTMADLSKRVCEYHLSSPGELQFSLKTPTL